MATYTSNARITKITTGDETGTWGSTTNSNLDFIDEALGYATHSMPDAADTITITDGASSTARALFIDITGTLTANRVLTVAPNTLQKVWIFQNSTTGGFDVDISQGSGANVTVTNGATEIVYADGGGATAAVVSVGLGSSELNPLTTSRIDPVSGSGIGINRAAQSTILCEVGGAFTSSGASDQVRGLRVDVNLTAAVGDTSQLSQLDVQGSITTQGNSETITLVAGVYVAEPDITVGTGDTVTTAATVYIANAPTEGTNNWALLVADGYSRFNDRLEIDTNDTYQLAIRRSADVAHGLASGTDLVLRINSDANGGANIVAQAEDTAALTSPMTLQAWGGQADTTKTTAGRGMFHLSAIEHDGVGSAANVTANGNVFGVEGWVGGGLRSLFLIDEDGDFHYDGVDGGAFDSEDDAELVRAFAVATAPGSVIRSEFDDFLRYNEEDLVRMGILGAPVSEGGLVNGAQVQRLVVGAIWQQETKIREQAARIEELERRMLPA